MPKMVNKNRLVVIMCMHEYVQGEGESLSASGVFLWLCHTANRYCILEKQSSWTTWFIFHTYLPLQLYHICFGKSSKSVERSGNTDGLSKVPDSVIYDTTTIAEAFVPELTKATFGHVAHARKIEICRFAVGSVLHVRERHEAKKSFSEVSQREHRIREAAS